MSSLPQRKSPRLTGYDYRQDGIYFVTICTYQYRHLFGTVCAGETELNVLGCIAQSCWEAIPHHFAHVALDAYVVMPNHLHGLLVFNHNMEKPPVNAERESVRTRYIVSVPNESVSVPNSQPETFAHPVAGSLAAVMRTFKAAVTRQINRVLLEPTSVWHGRYYDHIVRHERALAIIRNYILTNPARWPHDRYYS